MAGGAGGAGACIAHRVASLRRLDSPRASHPWCAHADGTVARCEGARVRGAGVRALGRRRARRLGRRRDQARAAHRRPDPPIIRSGFVADADGTDYLWELFNRNKRGIALDVQPPAGREVFERLVRWADVYVTNQLPRVRRKLRTEPDDLFALNPTLVFAKGHGQGQRGDDAEAGGYDSVSFWSRGGVGHMLTPPDAAGS